MTDSFWFFFLLLFPAPSGLLLWFWLCWPWGATGFMLTFRYSQCHSSLSCVTITALQMDFIWRGTAASRVNDKDGMVKSQVLDRLYWAGGCPFTLALICSNNTEFLPTKQLCHLAWSGQLGVVLPQRKTLLTDHLLLRRQICPVTFTFSLPKPIKHLMCLLSSPGQ